MRAAAVAVTPREQPGPSDTGGHADRVSAE